MRKASLSSKPPNNPATQDPMPAAVPADAAPDVAPDAATNLSSMNEKYVAQLLREKTALEVAIDKLKADLSRHSLEIVDLKTGQ